ncbi:MAG: cell division protein ZapA [Polaromonas sp.]|jgi:cell division protein ZapA|nr:cell division protein ZapA [Polaromonas sp.]
MKQLDVQIMGQSYLLRCPDDGDAQLLEAVSKVDEAMCKIRDVGKIKARDRIAVLAALNLAFELAERSASSAAAPVNVQPPEADAPNPQLGALLQRLDVALGQGTHPL